MKNETNEVKLASARVAQTDFFGVYQDLLAEKGFDESGKPKATLKDLGELFPTLKPLTVKQKLYSVLSAVNEHGHNYPMLPTGDARKTRQSKKEQVTAELIRMAEARKVFDSVD